jgi:hypothetical protein
MNIIVQGPSLATKITKFLRSQKYCVSTNSNFTEYSFYFDVKQPGWWFPAVITTVKFESIGDCHKLNAECSRKNLEDAKIIISALEKFVSDELGSTVIAPPDASPISELK